MAVSIITAPFQIEDLNGLPVSGGYLESYGPNGSATPKALYSDKAGTVSVGVSHTLNSLGMFTDGVLYGSGDYYFRLFDADSVLIDDWEYIEGEGSGNNAATEWVASVNPTYISATSFSVPGDLTSEFHVNRRVKTDNTGGTVYGTITASAYTSLTTVTVVNDSGVLDSGLSAVDLGFLRADNQSFPSSKSDLIDVNGLTALTVATTASQVNAITVTPAITGNNPSIEVSGEDVGLDIEGITLKNGVINKGVIQVQTAVDSVYQSTASNIPIDNTVPLISEGLSLVDVSITPKFSDSQLVFSFVGMFAGSSDALLTVSLIDVTGAATLTASIINLGSNIVGYSQGVIHWVIDSPGLTANTYRIRFGANTGTSYVNGSGTARLYGGAAGARLTVTEIRN